MTTPRARARTDPGASSRVAIVRRSRILEDLQLTSSRAICISAPGGYGKSTVLAQWAEADARPFVSVTVHPPVANAFWVGREILGRLEGQGLIPEPVEIPESLDPIVWHTHVLPAIRKAVASLAVPIVVGVDEAGLLHGPQWESLLECLVRGLPEGSAVALATREGPPSVFRDLRSSGGLLEIEVQDLSLDAMEGSELVRGLGVALSDGDLLRLLERTEGWPVAVYLGALATRSGQSPSSSPIASYGSLADYIRDHIVESLDPHDARFLLEVSVLTSLDGPTCNAVTGRTDSLKRLRRLAQTHHLVTAMDARGEHFRMHQLMADFLRSEFESGSSAEWQAAHAVAGHAYEVAGDIDTAVYHGVLAGDDEALGELIWRHTGPLLGSGRVSVLKRWIGWLGSERLETCPRLALVAAHVAQLSGDMVAMSHYRLVVQRACDRGAPRDLCLDATLLRAVDGSGGVAEMGRLAAEYVAGASPGSDWLPVGYFLQGISLVLRGEPESGATSVAAGLRLATSHDQPLMQAQCGAGLALISLLGGDQDRGLAHLREVNQVMGSHPLDHVATAAPVFVTQALGYLVQGRIHEARLAADTGLRLTSLVTAMAPWYAVLGRLVLSQVYLGLGQAERALSLLGEAELAHGPASSAPLIDLRLEEARDTVGRAGLVDGGPEQLTTAEIRVVQYLPTHLTFPEIAAELFVSRFTVKTQALSAYRKLDAHSRSEAVARARQIGILPPA